MSVADLLERNGIGATLRLAMEFMMSMMSTLNDLCAARRNAADRRDYRGDTWRNACARHASSAA